MEKINILLATYNGERYIEQQILSLLAQTERSWTCYIHDDGSTDNTVEIIKKWANIDKRIVLIEDGVSLKNAGKNFLHLLKYSKSDFVCFCDQDDVWLDSKLEKLFSTIKQKNNTIPQVVFSNAYLWDDDKNFIHDKAILAFPKRCKDLLFLNCGIQGASCIFNKKMKDILINDLIYMCMHDYYLTLAGIFLGEIDYINENLMLYRQHSNNVTGNADGNFIKKIKNFFSRNIPVVNTEHYKSLECFYEKWNKEIKGNDKKLICDFFNMRNMGCIGKIFYVLKNKYTLYNSKFLLIAKIIFRPYYG
ncbi:MAG: glycosyltransferase family 2 protein [Treponema sp.]|nr:glycosyltransferase family 2 protein [Treponema sp.]